MTTEETIMQDGDGNQYLVPNEKCERFEQLQSAAEDHPKATQMFIDEFTEYLLMDNETQLFICPLIKC